MNDLTCVFYINGALEQVWQALVSPEASKKIAFGSELQSTFEVGGRLRWVGPGRDGEQTVHIYGDVLSFEPNRRFSYTCRVGEAYGAEHEDIESRVTYTLESAGPCAKLSLVHDQWKESNSAYEGTAKGWPMMLSSIKTLVETSEALPMTTGLHG